MFVLTNIFSPVQPIPVIFIVALPILLIITALVYVVLGKKQLEIVRTEKRRVDERLEAVDGCSRDNLVVIDELAENAEDEQFAQAMLRLKENAELKYDNRWLPNPLDEFNNANISGPQLRTLQQRLLPIILLVIGWVGSFILYLLPQLNLANATFTREFLWIPGLVGTALAVLLYQYGKTAREELANIFVDLRKSLSRKIPVFTDHSANALLVNQMMDHDYRVQQGLEAFNETTKRLIEGKFVETINEKFETVMREQVAESVRRTAENVSETFRKQSEEMLNSVQNTNVQITEFTRQLTEQQNEINAELYRRQQNDMGMLAGLFTQNVVDEMAARFEPIGHQLDTFNRMMDETRNFIHDSVAILENSRQQNIKLNQDISKALQAMETMRESTEQQMLQVNGNIKAIGEMTREVGGIFGDEQNKLSRSIEGLDGSLGQTLNVLEQNMNYIRETGKMSETVHSEEREMWDNYLNRLAEVNEKLDSVQQSLTDASARFTDDTRTFLENSLNDMDNHLAEVVERLVFTTAAIRDAVDGLPIALRNEKDNR